MTLAEPGPVCSSKHALLTPCPAPSCRTCGSCLRHCPCAHPKPPRGSDSPLGTKSSHVLLPPETWAWPKAPSPKLPKHCITLTSACKSSVWRAGYGSLDRHSRGGVQGYRGFQVGSVRHRGWTAVHTVPWTATEPTDSVQLSKHTQSLLMVPFQGIWGLGHSWLQLVYNSTASGLWVLPLPLQWLQGHCSAWLFPSWKANKPLPLTVRSLQLLGKLGTGTQKENGRSAPVGTQANCENLTPNT